MGLPLPPENEFKRFNFINKMDSFEDIDSKILSMVEGEIALKKESFAKPAIMVVLGVSLLFLSSRSVDLLPEGALKMVGCFSGLALCVGGMLLSFSRRSRLFHVASNRPLRRIILDFDAKSLDRVVDLYERNDFHSLMEMSHASNAGVRMMVLGLPDGSLCFTQLMKFIPYTFEPVTEVRRHENDMSIRSLFI